MPDTLNWATPLVGMTLAAAIPLRGGMVNLGGDGQLVIGGLIGALAPLFLPAPGPLAAILGLALAALGGGLYAASRPGAKIRHSVPMLISSLLLGYPAVGVTSYLARFPFRDVMTGLPQTLMVPLDARLYMISGPLNVGILIIAAIALARHFRRSSDERGIRTAHARQERRFAEYGGVRLGRKPSGAMFSSGAIAGPRRGDRRARLAVPVYRQCASSRQPTPGPGLMAALLASGEPAGTIVAALFFAALQTGGFAMQRETLVPRVLTLVLQSIVILFLAMRRDCGGGLDGQPLHAVSVPIRRAGDHARSSSLRLPACFADGSACSIWRSRA